jgi:hypothetical protein
MVNVRRVWMAGLVAEISLAARWVGAASGWWSVAWNGSRQFRVSFMALLADRRNNKQHRNTKLSTTSS